MIPTEWGSQEYTGHDTEKMEKVKNIEKGVRNESEQ